MPISKAMVNLNSSGARLPVAYEQAKSQLAKCATVDECKDWADKAAALASYARQSQDESLRRMAERIQARAIKRCGALLAEVEPQTGKRNQHTALRTDTDTKQSREEVATAAGLSKRQKDTALRVAAVPDDAFEAQVESEKPPSVATLAQQGTRSKPKPPMDLGGRDPGEFRLSTAAQADIARLAEMSGRVAPSIVIRGSLDHEVAALRRNAKTLASWLDRLITQLEK